MNKPKRAFEITINVCADTWPDAIQELARVAEHVTDHGPECNAVSGSPSTGHIVTIDVNPNQTHENYHREVLAYLAELRKAKETNPA